MVLLVYCYVIMNTRKDYIMNYETLNKEEFDKVLHGNRSITNKANHKKDDHIIFYGSIDNPFFITAKVKSVYKDTIKTTKGERI